MSSFVVSTDHIDYLVTAALAYVPDHTSLVVRGPTELGRTLLAENVETVVERYLEVESEDELGDDEREELATYRAQVDGYVFRSVGEVDAAQAVSVAACWRYQAEREWDHDEEPSEMWFLTHAVEDAALASLPASAFVDPGKPRNRGNLVGRESLAWEWHRTAD